MSSPNKSEKDYISLFSRVDDKIDDFFMSLNPIDKKRRPVTKTLPFEQCIDKERYIGYRHAAHAMIWSDAPAEGNYTKQSALVNMQMRFDGQLGFPGGIVDEQVPSDDADEAMKIVTAAVIREIKEELNFEVEPNEPKYVATFVASNDTKKSFVLHTFLIKLTPERFKEMERNSLESTSEEVLGNIRVPLCVKSEKVWTRYLTMFLLNNFISIADRQLLKMMVFTGIISEPQLETVMKGVRERL